MRRFIDLSLATLLIVATAQAKAMPQMQSTLITTTQIASDQLSAADLVTFARRGYFKDQGIPSYGAFDSDFAAGRVTPEVLVKSAIAANRLSPGVLNNQGYLNAVEAQLIGVRAGV